MGNVTIKNGNIPNKNSIRRAYHKFINLQNNVFFSLEIFRYFVVVGGGGAVLQLTVVQIAAHALKKNVITKHHDAINWLKVVMKGLILFVLYL